MKRPQATCCTALVLLLVLAACSSPGTPSLPGAGSLPASRSKAPSQTSVLARIVGVGDSLTAGFQAGGFLGATNVKNPLLPGLTVPPGQENGWWSDLVEQASGKAVPAAVATMYDPAVSPLPLIAGPGLDNQVIAAEPPSLGQPIIGQEKSGDACTDFHGFNQAGYLRSGLSRVRMNPNSTTVRNFGVPGITLHEANTLSEPQSSTCQPLPGVPGLLSEVVADESGTFWPVLGNFAKLGSRLTLVNAAASVHPSLATVWLGANDVLKYMGSGGRFTGGDRTTGQVESDLRETITTLQHAGARVVAANLPNILETGYFMRVDKPKNPSDCKVQTYVYCVFATFALRDSARTEIARKYHLNPPGACVPTSTTQPCGYLTLPGALDTIQYATTHLNELPDLDCAELTPHCKPVPGSGLGTYYITPSFAAKVQSLNNTVNQGIDQAATASHVPLVDIATIFDGLASGNTANPYFEQAASVRPGVCCTLGFLYGLLSFDGLHPSNTGYALVAYYFIQTINQSYGTHIPQIDLHAVYAGTRCQNKHYCFPDPYAPPHDGLVPSSRSS